LCSSSPPETGKEPHEFAEDEERPPRTEIGLAETGKASRASLHAPAKNYKEPTQAKARESSFVRANTKAIVRASVGAPG
jgi:hypothetical protein